MSAFGDFADTENVARHVPEVPRPDLLRWVVIAEKNCHSVTSCQHREFVGGAQAPLLRVPLAEGTLVATPEMPSDDLLPSLQAASDVFGTRARAATVRVMPATAKES